MPMRAVSVPTTLVPLVSYNQRRRTLDIFNLGANTIYISQDQVNVTTQGTPILSNTSLSLSRREGDEPELGLYAQALVGTNDVRITEGFGDPEHPTGSQ